MPFRVMLDTDVTSSLIRQPLGPIRARIAEVGPDAVCISVITLGELEFGAANKPSARGLSNFELILGGLPAVPLEPATGGYYGNIRATLRRLGTPIGPNDTWIAAHALSLDLTLITANVREFSRVPGLRIENWLS